MIARNPALCHALVVAVAFIGACADSPTANLPQETPLVALSLDYCATNAPVWFGYKNEGAPWRVVTGNASATYAFEASPKVIIAVVGQDVDGPVTTVTYATAAELATLSGIACVAETGTRSYRVSTGSVGAGESAEVSIGQEFTEPFRDENYLIGGIPERPMDVVAVRSAVGDGASVPNRIIIRRGIDAPSMSVLPRLDFSAAEAFEPVSAQFTVTGVGPGEESILVSQIRTANGTNASLSNSFPNSTSTAIRAVPANQLVANDVQYVGAIAFDESGFERGALKFFYTPAAQSVAIGAALNVPTVGPAVQGSTGLRVQVASQADYRSGVSFRYCSSIRCVQLNATAAYSGGTPVTWDVAMPDMTTASGFQSAWTVAAGGAEWELTVFDVSRAALILGAFGRDGDTLRFAALRS